MYRKSFYIFVTLLSFALIFGCGKSSEQKNLEKAAEKMEEAGEKMADAGEKMAESMGKSVEGMGEGVEGMAEAMKQMSEALGGDSKIEPVDFRELKALLPEKLGNFNRTNATGEKTSAFGIKVSNAEADYENDEGQRVNINITDMASMKKMVMMAQYGWLMADFDRESDTGYERTITYKGIKGYEKYENDSQSGDIQLFVGERFVVDVNGFNVKITDLKNALDKLELKKLECMRSKE